jgi:hypothetical protein
MYKKLLTGKDLVHSHWVIQQIINRKNRPKVSISISVCYV